MFAYGIGGLLAGLFAMWGILKKRPPRAGKDVIILAVFGFFGILLVVGPLLDTSTFFTMATSYDAASVLAVYLAGVPVNCVHGAAVALTMLLFGKPLLERLQRIQIKYGMMEPFDAGISRYHPAINFFVFRGGAGRHHPFPPTGIFGPSAMCVHFYSC